MTSQESAVTPNTYAKLFPEQLSNTCSPEAPEANCGPIAYLSALYQQALSLAYLALTEDTPFYNWLVARQEQIYGAAYDVVRSLCLGWKRPGVMKLATTGAKASSTPRPGSTTTRACWRASRC